MKGGWVAEAAEMLKKKAGCLPRGGVPRIGKELKIVQRDTGLSEKAILRRWEAYLANTPVRYLSPTRFRETINAWAPEVHQRMRVDAELDRQHKKKLEQSQRAPRDNDEMKRLDFLRYLEQKKGTGDATQKNHNNSG